MTTYVSLLHELDQAIARGTREQRAEALERVTRLFVRGATQFSDEQIELFDHVIARLVEEIEERALVELSRVLAPVPNAPSRIMRRLAQDDNVAIAGPVLKLSSRLEEEDLVGVARTQSQAHLFAIAGRKGIDQAVTDVLVRRGDREVVRGLAVNAEAKLSDAAYATLVTRAGADGVLAVHVASRADIPLALFQRLVMRATSVVQSRLLASVASERQTEIKRVLAKIAGEMGGAPPRDYRIAQEHVAALRCAGGLNENVLAEFACGGDFERTAAALSALCRVPITVIDRLMNGASLDPILILCKAQRCSASTVAAVLSLRLTAGSPTMEGALAQFGRLSTTTTQRIVHFWRAQPMLEAAGA